MNLNKDLDLSYFEDVNPGHSLHDGLFCLADLVQLHFLTVHMLQSITATFVFSFKKLFQILRTTKFQKHSQKEIQIIYDAQVTLLWLSRYMHAKYTCMKANIHQYDYGSSNCQVMLQMFHCAVVNWSKK